MKTLSIPEVLAIALDRLDGSVIAVDTEDLAVKANELQPGRFSWKKYPDQINIEQVRKSCVGPLLTGSHAKGWSLTTEGKKWVDGLPPHFLKEGESFSRSKHSRGGGIEEEKWRRELKRIEQSVAYTKWLNGEVPSHSESEEIFKIDYYATEDAKNRKVNRLKQVFTDGDVRDFIDVVSHQLNLDDPSEEKLP